MNTQRRYTLDYLRGAAAFGIMIYHYLSWTLGEYAADTFLGRLGIYGVSIFYVLSGLTLYHVYYDKMQPAKEDLIKFFKKRIFRIFPLLWLVTIVAILLSGKTPGLKNLFLNLTGLFGFVRWDRYFSVGVWSIGNELVFYVFFPLFVLLTKKYRYLMAGLTSLLFGLYLYFTFVKLEPALTLAEQWRDYINPLNQVFLFLGGFLLGLCLRRVKFGNPVVVTTLFSALALFILYPVVGGVINLVTGTNRLVFTACCFLVCAGFYELNLKLPDFVHRPLTLLGEASYSVYLLHPIVYTLIELALADGRKYLFPFPASFHVPVSILLTLVLSHYVYQHFEKYFMKFGRSQEVRD